MIDPLMRKLERLGPLPDEARRAVEGIPLQARAVPADQDLVREGERSTRCLLLLEGFACRYKLLEEGRRQIVSFHIPGDFVDLTSLLLPQMDHSIATLTPVRVAPVPHAAVLGWMRRHEALGHALWRDVLIDASVFREWVVNVGRRTAYQRIAHLLCEVVARMRAVGLARGDTCDLPIAQAELADATGLSAVHVNRALQELRGQGLVKLDGRTLAVRDWPGLKRAAEFDSRYLHQLAAAA